MQDKIIIAGPCAAESEEQLMATAKAICSSYDGPLIFRAGVWKPRTNPNTFQGIGEQALAWLQRIQQTMNIAVATEVATASHVVQAMQMGIDYLWIGARTSANPIQVQALTDVIAQQLDKHSTHRLKGLLVKNPMHQDAALWIGNIERMERLGIPVWAVHRGCSHQPAWEMAYTLHQTRPDIPLLIDPSHMGGNKEAIAPLLTNAWALQYDGAMIETHINPQDALSDAKQQLSPDELVALLSADMPKTEDCELMWLRSAIDEVDNQLWELIEHRMSIANQIGMHKRKQSLAIIQQDRFQHILNKRLAWGKAHQLSDTLIHTVMNAIHDESINVQER